MFALLALFIAIRLLSWLRRYQVFGDAYSYYIPAGIAYVRGALPNTINFEHPPLAKYIIGTFAIYFGRVSRIAYALFRGRTRVGSLYIWTAILVISTIIAPLIGTPIGI